MRDDEDAVPASIDFKDLDVHASEHLSSFGQSLLNLTLASPSMSNFSDLNAEIEMKNLQIELVSEIITDDGISAATGNIEMLRREIEGM
jgi:hypothetical protein